MSEGHNPKESFIYYVVYHTAGQWRAKGVGWMEVGRKLDAKHIVRRSGQLQMTSATSGTKVIITKYTCINMIAKQ
jgi:hypothetical protein